jgi:hypothetical protein
MNPNYRNIWLNEKDSSLISGDLFCDSCGKNTKHYTKAIGSNGKTYCLTCNNLTEYTDNCNEGHDL